MTTAAKATAFASTFYAVLLSSNMKLANVSRQFAFAYYFPSLLYLQQNNVPGTKKWESSGIPNSSTAAASPQFSTTTTT